MSYSWKTFSASRTDLANRLGDPSKIHWTDDELSRIVKEALRTRSCIAQSYRDRCEFNTQNGISFYDLTQTANPNAITGGTGTDPTNPPPLLGYSLTDRDLINDIQYHLIEPATTNWVTGWTGTSQYTMADVLSAIQTARNLFVQLVSPHLTHSQAAAGIPPASGRIQLSDSISIIRRIAWKTFEGIYLPLWRETEWSANATSPGWSINPGTPEAYSTILEPRVALQLIPIHADVGTIDLITVNIPANLDEQVGTLLNIPDDYAWIVKFGALAILFSKDSQSYDAGRSAYCQARFDEGVRYCQLSGTINQSFLDGVPTIPDSMVDFDAFTPNWQNVSVVSGANLTSLAILGRNLIAVSPVPNDDPHSVQLDVVRNAPIPTTDGSFLQIGREDYSTFLDYCIHLAMLKEGGGEFSDTFQLLNNFMQQNLTHSRFLNAEAKNYDIMQQLSKKEELDRPRLDPQMEEVT